MGKYTTTYKNALNSFLQYRLNLGLLFMSHIITLTGLLSLWVAIYGSEQHLPNYDLTQIITYYVLITILRITIADGVGMGFEVVEEIHEGLVANYMLKPFNYALEQLMKLLGRSTINIVFVTPAIVVLLLGFRSHVSLPSITIWLQFLGLCAIALLMYYLIYFLVASLSFWIHRGRSVIYGVVIISMFLNGSYIPLDLFPVWSQPVVQWLPFHFLIYTPIQGFLGTIASWSQLLGLAVMWIVILSCLIAFIWHLGIRKFESVGR